MPDILKARGKHNALKRYRTADDPDLIEASRDLKAESLAEHVRQVVDTFPELTAEQRNRIAALLRPSPGGDRAA